MSASAAADHQPGLDSEFDVKSCPDNLPVDFLPTIESAPTQNACDFLPADRDSDGGTDRSGVLIYGWLPDAIEGGHENHYVIVNRSADSVVYEGGAGSRLYLQPRSAARNGDPSPTLFLSVLIGEPITVPAGRQRLVTFEGIDVAISASYWSEPQALPTCGTGAEETPAGCRCQSGYQNLTGDDTQTCEMIPPPDDGDPGNGETPDNPGNGGTSTPPQRGKADFAQRGGVVVGLMGFMVALYYLGGGADDFSFSPDFGYAITESGYSYKYGGRVDFRKDAWSLYWTAGQQNANGEFGDFRYASGGEYDGGFWKAAFSESVRGDITDYDFSLSADWNGGIWRLSPTYRFRSRFDDGESESGSALNLEGALRYNRWTLRTSAGFRWRRADDFGDGAKFGITAAREF